MPRFEHKVYRVMVMGDGADYYLGAMVQKDEDWLNVDRLGEQGWEFVAFVPDPEVYIKDSFDEKILPLVRLAVFKRQLGENFNRQMEGSGDAQQLYKIG